MGTVFHVSNRPQLFAGFSDALEALDWRVRLPDSTPMLRPTCPLTHL